MKVLLLENISGIAVKAFRDAGYEVESLTSALDERDLIGKLRDVSILGVRSKTRVSAAAIEAACARPPLPEGSAGHCSSGGLLAIGAFCIGVDKIDREAASERGVAVFNDPHSNSRSVAELAIGEIILLLRRTVQASAEMHRGIWNKSAAGAHEVRGLTLGIVGYGKIGSQLSDLAEAMGMRVIFYDVSDVLARGNARRVEFRELLCSADVVTLHVDGKPQNRNLFGGDEFAAMKHGACFLNLSRGFVVDHDALAVCLESGKIAGAAIDVFPREPESGGEFVSTLREMPNVILTPHIGGSTEEAQQNIGSFVSTRLLEYVRTGNSTLSVNLPHCQLEFATGSHRLMHIHRNVPGILRAINQILAERGINIERQVLDTRGPLGYAIYDIDRQCDAELISMLQAVPHTISVRAAG